MTLTRGGRAKRGLAAPTYVVGLGLLAAAVTALLPVRDLAGADRWVLPLLGLLVGAAEFLQVRFRFGGQVDSSNLVEAALAPLLVLSPDVHGVLAVAVGQALAAAVRRNPPVKSAFNIAQWSLATAVGSLVLVTLDAGPPSTWTGAAALLLAVLCVGVINLLSFTGVMALVRRQSPRQVLRGVAPLFGGSWLPGLAVNTLIGLLFALAHQAASAAVLLFPVPLVVLHQAFRGYAEARNDRARLLGMQRAAGVLSDPLDPHEAVADFLVEAARCFDTRAASLVLRVGDLRQVHTVVDGSHTVRTEAQDARSLEAAVSAQLGAARLSAQDQGPLAQALREAGWEDCLAAPLHDSGRTLGALLLLDQAGVDGGTVGQLTVLEALAREVAAAFAKGDLLASVLEERRKLSTLVSTTSDGIASLDADGTVRSWNAALTRLTGRSEAQVVGLPGALAPLDLRSATGAPVDLGTWADRDVADLPPELSLQGPASRLRLACSWSRADDGLLVVVARDVTPVAEHEALRLEFDRLVQQENARRLVVEQLQKAVVPEPVHVPGLELAVAYVASDPQEPTGGDLWDWQLLPDGELHLAVVDVLGHGVAATKSALSVVHTLRTIALDGTPLVDMVARASTLVERQDADLVATVVLARLDPATGRLRIASGGHPPALVFSGSGEVRQVEATGGAVGWPGAGSHGVEELVLAPGDALLLYTDGLVEARKDIVEGIDSLVRETASVSHLPAGELCDELVARALAGADRRDDTLALVVRRTAGAGPSGSTARWTVRPDQRAGAQARRDAVRWLDERQLPSDTAALVIAELLSNAIRVASEGVALELDVVDGRVHVSVSDDGPGLRELPGHDLPSLSAEGSRGLFLVGALTDDLQLESSDGGTTVRCRVDDEPAAVPAQPSGPGVENRLKPTAG